VIGFLLRRPWRLPRLLLALPTLIGYPLALTDRGLLKAAIARAAFGGLSRAAIAAWTNRYVERVVPQGLFAAALQAVAAHRANGDHLVLMSASPDLYVPQIGRALGFDEVVCTELSWDGDRFVGRLLTANRRGAEKVRCLAALRSAYPDVPVSGYGNSQPDVEHLCHCDSGYYVNARPGERAALQALGLLLVDWR
jgi:phosphatidylglycerophosphatase C